MVIFDIKMKHSEDSLKALSRMQYDLFAKKSRVIHTILCFACLVVGALNFSEWWGILLLAYGGYLTVGGYNYPDYKARKIAKQFREAGVDFPASRFAFEKSAMHIFSLPDNTEADEPLGYSRIYRLGEDTENFYIFPNQYGGYVIPKSQLEGKELKFKEFLEEKTGKGFDARRSPLGQLQEKMRRKRNEPYHL